MKKKHAKSNITYYAHARPVVNMRALLVHRITSKPSKSVGSHFWRENPVSLMITELEPLAWNDPDTLSVPYFIPYKKLDLQILICSDVYD